MGDEQEGKKPANADANDCSSVDSNSENSSAQPENPTTNTSNKKNGKKGSKALQEVLMNDNMKFLSNFDPELSNREKRKLSRKINAEKKNNPANDENAGTEKDLCDCLIDDCPGCHFPCPKCRSYKCGFECRVNRKWTYEGIENETDTGGNKNSTASTNCCILHS